MILDATAGNRLIWGGRKAPYTIYMDKEVGLARPPDIFGDNTRCPFRDGVFETVIYDPPHYVNAPPWMTDPEGRLGKNNFGTFFGNFETKTEMLTSIRKAQKEFQRIANRLCLKWVEGSYTLWKILPFFKGWTMIHKLEMSKGRTRTYWITFIRALHRTPKNIEKLK